ncbi:hypothetical protein FNF29_06447 [Cafeteria roenbergensis]|uniref:Ion transport domain-containing protein n=1 Tax=Cafeteria roenbergensis TaxID=33653 RepID=A0A5A8C6X1_CAFRO|nr:hypothetical protein FNF29_06447 [Cafeteria roenbergensis]|eukprot:KAA0148822.1 hypothetical protein FNF29_06447 [Cafeteria roenbergensis]
MSSRAASPAASSVPHTGSPSPLAIAPGGPGIALVPAMSAESQSAAGLAAALHPTGRSRLLASIARRDVTASAEKGETALATAAWRAELAQSGRRTPRRGFTMTPARRLVDRGQMPKVPPRKDVEQAHRERRDLAERLDSSEQAPEQAHRGHEPPQREDRQPRRDSSGSAGGGGGLAFGAAVPRGAARRASELSVPRVSIAGSMARASEASGGGQPHHHHHHQHHHHRHGGGGGDGGADGDEEEGPTAADVLPLASCRDKVVVALQTVVSSWWFGLGIVLAILVNTVVLALDSYPVDTERARVAEILNFILSVVFLLEMLLKLAAMGPRAYSQDAFNVFDAVIVIISVVEVAVSPPVFLGGSAAGTDAGGVSALRTFRLLRILKLARAWVSLRVLLATVLASLSEVGNFAAVTLLFVMVIALFGAFSFANRFRFNAKTGQSLAMTDPAFSSAEPSPINFDDLWSAFVAVFVVLASEQWTDPWFDAWRASGLGGALFFVVAVVMLQIVLLNLFLAILLSKFEGLEEKTELERRRRRRALRRIARAKGTAPPSVALSGTADDETATVGTATVGDNSVLRFHLDGAQPDDDADLPPPRNLWERLSRVFGSLRDPQALEVASATNARLPSGQSRRSGLRRPPMRR